MKLLSVLVGLGLLAAAGCGDDASGDDDDVSVDASPADPDAAANTPDAAGTPDATPPDAAPDVDAFFDPTGTHTQYVANTIDVPSNSTEATALGQDIDGDLSIDNALGSILGSLASMGADPQAAIDGFVANGEILQIFDVQATDLVDADGVAVRGFAADDGDEPPNPADNFSGSETFVIKPGSPAGSMLLGDITGGNAVAGPGTMPLSIVIGPGTPPVIVELVGARFKGGVTATTITNGLLGGAITAEEVDAVLIPGIAAALNIMVAEDCVGTTCDPDSAGEDILLLFDDNDDGVITAEELRANALIQSLLAPDVDLFDATGAFNPNTDGENDALSFGVGFTAVGAVFDLP